MELWGDAVPEPLFASRVHEVSKGSSSPERRHRLFPMSVLSSGIHYMATAPKVSNVFLFHGSAFLASEKV